MKLIAISPAENTPNETGEIIALFEKGLEIFHVHKPGLSSGELQNYTRRFPWKYRERIYLHEDFPKFHSLNELQAYKKEYEYAFLSPIFDSISKKDHKASFDLEEVREKIQNRNIIALGGIDEDKIEICRELGFAGVAVLGAIWGSNDPLQKFLLLNQLCHSERSEESTSELDTSLRSA